MALPKLGDELSGVIRTLSGSSNRCCISGRYFGVCAFEAGRYRPVPTYRGLEISARTFQIHLFSAHDSSRL